MKNLIVFILFVLPAICYAQSKTNFTESKVPEYELPEVLVTQKGEKVTTRKDWIEKRRPELIRLFEENMYGKVPGELKIHSYQIIEQSDNALNNKAVRKQLVLNFQGNGKEMSVAILIYLPKNIKKAPLFLGYNFYGNQTIINDTNIILNKSWVRNNPSLGIVNHVATEQSRGGMNNRWAIDMIIEAGYGVATMYYGDVDPDKARECGVDYTDGVHYLLYKKGQTKPLPDQWGAISAWAWGLSRAMDYLENDNDVDKNRIIVFGHSRLGKTALWAGALDQRFSAVISNSSGCGGAALSRRRYGERLSVINQKQEGWLCGNSKKYDWKEDELPVDQHELIALLAPRTVYIASAKEDNWADPKGEFLSGYYASPVYELFGKVGITANKMPEVNQPIMNTIGYHIRKGKHDITDYDWEQFIKFLDKH
jgi:hypothetical protein